jgi:cation diffusion facilitator CzcD-associated flavoprotein CzcO
LYVFQRTPVVVLPRGNRPTDPEWVETLQPGWHRERVETFNRRGNAFLDEPDAIQDGWTEVVFPVMATHGAGLFGDAAARKEAEMFDLEMMDAVRRRISELVHDPDTAARLMPYFRMLCKRPSFHDEYLQAYNRPNVTLVDTEGAGVERVTTSAVVVRGEAYEVDCLILATGFDTGRGLLKSWGLDFIGRDGIRLSEYWKTGMRTFHGVFVREFPNLFLHSTTQNAGPPNYSSSSVEISEYIVDVISRLKARGAQSVETTKEAEAHWVQTIHASTPETHLEFFRNCTPGYYNNDGDLDDIHRLGANNFLAGSVQFYNIIRSWREDESMPGLELR